MLNINFFASLSTVWILSLSQNSNYEIFVGLIHWLLGIMKNKFKKRSNANGVIGDIGIKSSLAWKLEIA